MNEIKKYDLYREKLKEMNISHKELANSNLWKVLMHHYPNKFILGQNIFKANIQSMCLESDPCKVRIRNDSFLRSSISKQSSILISSFKNKNQLFHYILSSKWFENYTKKEDASNSFINFNFDDLEYFANNPGYQYKKILKDKTKYIFLIISDDDFQMDRLEEYLTLSENSNLNFSYENIQNLRYDPQIPYKNREEVFAISNFSCFIHKYDKNVCRTKIDWVATKKALEGTNLSVPIDFHHFIPRSFFKKEWLKQEGNDLDWNFIHSSINLIPLCQICHQSIHNKDKKLSKETFDNIVLSLKSENLFEKFIDYLKETKFLSNLNELLDFYLK